MLQLLDPLIDSVHFYIGSLIATVVVLFTSWIVVRRSMMVVHTGSQVVIERFGRYSHTLEPGLNWLNPILDSVKCVVWVRTEEQRASSSLNSNNRITTRHRYVLHEIPVAEQAFDLAPFNAISRDRMQVSVNGILFFRITNVVKAVYAISDVYLAIENLVETAIRDFVANTNFEDVFQQRDGMAARVLGQFSDLEQKWGISVTRFDLQEIGCSNDVVRASEESMRKKREAEANLALARAEKETSLLETETESAIMMQQKRAELEAAEMSLKHQQRMLRIEVEEESARAAVRLESQTREAEAELRLQQLRRNEEFERQRGLLELEVTRFERLMAIDRVDAGVIAAKLHADAWTSMASNPNNKIVLPYEATRVFGTQQLLQQLVLGATPNTL